MLEKCKKCVAHRSRVNVITSHKWPVEHLHASYRLSHSLFYFFPLFQSFFGLNKNLILWPTFLSAIQMAIRFALYSSFTDCNIIHPFSYLFCPIFIPFQHQKSLIICSNLLFAHIFQWLFFFIEKVYEKFFLKLIYFNSNWSFFL
jgi:hypothetical protein